MTTGRGCVRKSEEISLDVNQQAIRLTDSWKKTSLDLCYVFPPLKAKLCLIPLKSRLEPDLQTERGEKEREGKRDK